MRIPLTLLTIFIIVCPATDFYIWRALGHIRKSHRLWQAVHLTVALICYALLAAALIMGPRRGDDSSLTAIMWMLFTVISIYIPKLIFIIIDLAGRIPVIFGRRPVKAVRCAGAVAAIISFGAIWYGALVNRFRLDVKEVTIDFPGLPDSFEGMTIVQISDLHTASFGSDTTFTAALVDRVNALKPDMVVFTGDIVSRRTEEVLPHIRPLSRLIAPAGVYAILGNHDYGDYYDWKDAAAKADNNARLRQAFRDMGWNLLLDRTEFITRGPDSLAIIGVENIGEPPFRSYGSLDRAYPAGADGKAKILLSHNPAHWNNDIAEGNTPNDIGLTLSGHTHAMQMELFGLSPAALRYPTWSGLYSDSMGRKLYVNIGTGTVGLPMRIGATPEITLITLSKGSPLPAPSSKQH